MSAADTLARVSAFALVVAWTAGWPSRPIRSPQDVCDRSVLIVAAILFGFKECRGGDRTSVTLGEGLAERHSRVLRANVDSSA